MNYKSDFKTRPLKKAIFIIASCQIRVVESLISTGTKKVTSITTTVAEIIDHY